MSARSATALDVTGLILAGGRGRRLGGRNKALLSAGGEPLVDRVSRALAPRTARLWISVGSPAMAQAARAWTSLPLIVDERDDQGPLAGLAAGLARAPGWLLAVAVDMPHLRGDVLDLLLARAAARGGACDACGACDAVAFRLGGLPEPLVALWGPPFAAALQRRLAAGQRKVADALLDPEYRVEWIDEAEVRAVDPELRAFDNVNDADDVAALVGAPR